LNDPVSGFVDRSFGNVRQKLKCRLIMETIVAAITSRTIAQEVRGGIFSSG
jgi:hypothetical protein